MELKPCPFCGCRMLEGSGGFEHPEASDLEASDLMDDCPLGGMSWRTSYYREKWNTRIPDPRIAELEAIILQLGANASAMAKHYQAEPGLTKEDYETIYGWGGQG